MSGTTVKPARSFALLVLALFMLHAPLSAAAEQRELYFGSVAMDIPAVMYRRLLPLIKYLSAGIGRPVTLRLAPNMVMAIRDISNGAVDLAYLTPVAYLRAHKQGNARLLVKTVTDHRGSFQLMIVVRENSPIKSVADLKGKTFAFGDKAALLQRATVVNAGIELEDFREYKFIGHYDNIVRAVMHGDFDAGILKDTMAYKWQGRGIRVLYASPPLPPYNIAVAANIDKGVYNRLKRLFLDLNDDSPEHLAIIHAMDTNYSGFAATSDAEYDIVRELVKPFDLTRLTVRRDSE